MENLAQKVRQYFQDRRFGELREKFDFPAEFIEGIETSGNRNEIYESLCQYTRRLQSKHVPKERIQVLLETISKYVVKNFGKQAWGSKCEFDDAMPLFYGLTEYPEHHDTSGELEKTIERFDFVYDLNFG
ncbi:MAG: hypothetical protein AABX93_03780 [Nanoarchaeota archaeon]